MSASRTSLCALVASLAFATTTSAAEAYRWGNVNFGGGGFVSAVIPSRTQPGLAYIRTDVGGAYRWDSTGGKWIPLLDWLSDKSLGQFGTEGLALDPHDPAKLYIFAGTDYFSGGKTVIFRSSNYGATFDTVDVTSQMRAHGNGMGRQAGEKLMVDPLNSAILYCGTRTKGLFRSADTGRTWSLVAGTTALSGTGIVNDNGISFVLFDTTGGKAGNGGTRNVYLGVSKTSGSLQLSTDGGASFAAVPGAPSQMAMRAAVVGSDIFGTFSAGPGPHSQNGGTVWKYSITGGTWTNITPKTDSGFYYASGHEGYGYGFGGISVDPTNPKRMIVSTEAYYGGGYVWPTVGKSNAGDQFFLTTDAGATWKPLMSWGGDDGEHYNVDPNGNGWITGSSIHWAGSIEFDPFNPKRVWVTSGNGMFRTDDVDAQRVVWKFQSKGIEETVPMDLVSIPGGPVVTALMDYDGATYDDITAETPVHPRPVGSSNSLGYAAKVGAFLRSGRVTDYGVSPAVTYDVLYHSKDSGRTWTMTDTSSLPGSGGTLAMSTDGRVFLLRAGNVHTGTIGTANGFVRSADGGRTWTAVTGLSAQKGLMVSDPVDAARFYILPDGYNPDFYASSDTGKTFSKISSLNGKDSSGNSEYSASSGMLRANPYAAGDLWVCLDAEQSWNASGYSSNGLAHSTDGGKTWTRKHSMVGCLTMGLGKAAPGATYPTLYMWGKANTDPVGIYRSIDKGETWEYIGDQAHQYGGPGNGNFVLGDWNVYGRVYMSTAGRGIVYGEPTSVVGVSRAVASEKSLRRSGSLLVAKTEIVLVDLRGRVVRASQSAGGSHRLDLRGLPHGLYVARAGSEGMRVESMR